MTFIYKLPLNKPNHISIKRYLCHQHHRHHREETMITNLNPQGSFKHGEQKVPIASSNAFVFKKCLSLESKTAAIFYSKKSKGNHFSPLQSHSFHSSLGKPHKRRSSWHCFRKPESEKTGLSFVGCCTGSPYLKMPTPKKETLRRKKITSNKTILKPTCQTKGIKRKDTPVYATT